MGTVLLEGQEATPQDIANLFREDAEAATEQTQETPTGNEAESGAGNGADFSFSDLSDLEGPKSSKKRRSLGPQDQDELAEFFTEDGIGAIVARGFDAFFVACDAEKMSEAERRNMAKVTAYYCRARLPKGAGAYQPELLLAATFAMAVLPRLGPIAEKTAPFWIRMRDKILGRFRKEKEE